MWTARSEKLADYRGLRLSVDLGEKPATFAEVLRGWREDAGFRAWFNALLAELPYGAFRWETPPVTARTEERAFECVALDSPGLAGSPDAEAFAEHFKKASEDGVVEFSNLGRDAVLIVPCPLGPTSSYGHIAAFVREAPERQRDVLWQMVGMAMKRRIGDKPVWLSTAGAGVSWLHVRLDDRPKYYGFGPWRSESGFA